MELARIIGRLRTKHGFGLIEMLVVILIISVLSVLLFPTFTKMRKGAQSATCMGNIKQLVSGITAYAADNDGFMPFPYQGEQNPSGSQTLNNYMINGTPWKDALPYVSTNTQAALKVFYCPTMTDPEYGARKEKEDDWKRSSYYYYAEFTGATAGGSDPYFKRERLGTSTNGIRALVSDLTRFPDKIPKFHDGTAINVGFTDGAVVHIRTDPAKEYYRDIFPAFPSGNTGADTIRRLGEKFKQSR